MLSERGPVAGEAPLILTPDQRLRVFVSSTLEELAVERRAVREAIESMRMIPVMFELGARPHPPRAIYRAYLEQSHVFVAIYWRRYGWIAPEMEVSGLEDEYTLAAGMPRLVYVKQTIDEREPRLDAMLDRIRNTGEMSYKAFHDAEELRHLVAEDLATLVSEKFHGSSALSSRSTVAPARLPAESTRFVGRQREIAEVVSLLGSEDVRLVTLTGPGGIGKTRLALRVAAGLESRYADGVAFVPLAAVVDTALLPQALATGLGLRAMGATPALDAITENLHDARLLLLLDNFEHLVDAAGVVTDLLGAAPGVQVLVTSRQPLHILAEHEFPVPPLTVGATEASRTALAEADAIQLFAARAAAQCHGFAIDAENVENVADICRRLDGVPLAIELAAARVKILPLTALRERLEKAIEFLVGGPRDLPDRQRTLHNTIAWSYELCGDVETRLYSRLSVFAGSFGLDAAEAICGDDGLDVASALESLVDKNLVRVDIDGPEARFDLLEIIREFALERLHDAGEVDQVAARHASYYRHLTVDAYDAMRLGRRSEWLARLGSDRGDSDNVRAALRWFLDHDDGDDVARMLLTLWLHMIMYGLLDEGRQITQAALELDCSAAGRARLLGVLGSFAEWQGDFAEGAAVLDEAIQIARQEHDDDALAFGLLARSFTPIGLGGPNAARQLMRDALALYEKIDNCWGRSLAMTFSGWISIAMEERLPLEDFEEALEVAHKIDNELMIAMSEANLADRMLLDGADDDAARLLSSALERFRALRVLYASAYGIDSAARVAASRDRTDQAARLIGASDMLRERIRVPIEPAAGQRRSRLVDELRDALGQQRFDDAWNDGHVLQFTAALDEAIAAVAHDHEGQSIPGS